MTANGFTELDNPGYFNLKEIKIDGTAYEINDISKFEDLLGLKVTAYYYEEKNSDKTVLCAVAEDDRAKQMLPEPAYKELNVKLAEEKIHLK